MCLTYVHRICSYHIAIQMVTYVAREKIRETSILCKVFLLNGLILWLFFSTKQIKL